MGRSFPGESFARLDPEGGGRVSRLAFKRALREIGFALVDEDRNNTSCDINGGERLGAVGDYDSHAQEYSGLGKNEQQRGVTKDKRDGNLGLVAEADETTDSGKGEEEVRLRRVEGEEDVAKREAFRVKVEEIERVTAAKVSSHTIGIALIPFLCRGALRRCAS